MASYTKHDLVANGNQDVNHDVELNNIVLKEKLDDDDNARDKAGSLLGLFMKLSICLVCGIFFGIALEKGRGKI